MSKVGLTAASFIQQKTFDKEKDRVDILVNACCPGNIFRPDAHNLNTNLFN